MTGLSVRLVHDGRAIPLRLVSVEDALGIGSICQDRGTYDLPHGAPRPSAFSQALVFGAFQAVFLDLPQSTKDQPAHHPFTAAHVVPSPGKIAVFRSPLTDGFELMTSLSMRIRIVTLGSAVYA